MLHIGTGFVHMCKSHKCVVIPLVVSNAKKIRYFFFHSLLVLPVEMTGRQNATPWHSRLADFSRSSFRVRFQHFSTMLAKDNQHIFPNVRFC